MIRENLAMTLNRELSCVFKKANEITPKDGYQQVTPELAKEWLLKYNYERQRAIRSTHVAMLSVEIKNGRFREKTQISFCRIGEDYYITNGQHTLSAIVHSGISVVLSVIVTDVVNMKEVADNFARHDTHLTRQLSDSLHAHELDNYFDITKTQLKLVAAAALYYSYLIGETKTQSTARLSNDQKLNMVMQHGELATAVVRMLEGSTNVSYLTRKTTLACVMLIYYYEPELAKSFFVDMVRDDGLQQGDPRKTLLELLKETTTIGGAFNNAKGRKARADHEFVKLIAHAWNAYVQRRTLKILKCDHDIKEATFDKCRTIRV